MAQPESAAPAVKPPSFPWDTLHNELSEEAKSIINRLAVWGQEPSPPPPHLALEEANASSPGLLEGSVMQNEAEFLQWYSNHVEHDSSSFGDDDVQHYPDLLESIQPYLSAATELTKEIDTAEEVLKSLEQKQIMVAKITDQLNKNAERLVHEEKHMNQVAESMRKNLSYFEEYESLSKKFNNPSLNVQDPLFLPLLAKVDDCILFMTENRLFLESELYLLKFRQLQTKGLTLIKNYVNNIFRETAQTILAASAVKAMTPISSPVGTPLKESGSSSSNPTTVDQERAMFSVEESSTVYLKLKAQNSKVKPLISQIENRSSHKEYHTLLTDLTQTYFEQRRLVLFPAVQSKLAKILENAKLTLKQTLDIASLKLISLTEAETELYKSFFSQESVSLRALMENLSAGFFDIVRSKVIFMDSLEDLLSINDVLRNEIIQRELKVRGSSVEALRPIVKRLTEDIQDRLLFVSSLIIRDDIESFIPAPTDIDYPEVLLKAQNIPKDGSSPLLKASNSSSSLADSTDAVVSPIKALAEFSTKGQVYYPTLNRTLALLSKLYLSVDNDAFDGIALSATNACTASLKRGMSLVAAKSSRLEAMLCLLMNLFALEVRLRPFDINFISTETSLDFSSIISAVKALLTGQKSIFSLSRDNALYNVIASSAPRIKTIQIDSKKEMDTLIQQTLDDVVDLMTADLISEVSSFCVQANAVLNASLSSASPSRLKEMQFAQPRAVNELIAKFDLNLKSKVPSLMDKSRLYFSSSIERQRLFKPFKQKITDTTMRLKQILNREYSGSEISPESVAILDSTNLNRFLDSTLLSSASTTEKYLLPSISILSVPFEIHIECSRLSGAQLNPGPDLNETLQALRLCFPTFSLCGSS